MAQNDFVVVGIDVAKDKVDACIRSLTLRQTFPNTAQGHRKLVAWLRKNQVGKAVMEASGGYEREWRNVLHNAGIEVRIVDPRRVRSFALSAGRLAKNDPIDAEMIAWFAETFSQAPGQIPDAAREELAALAKARKALVDIKIRLQAQDEHAAPEPAGLKQKQISPAAAFYSPGLNEFLLKYEDVRKAESPDESLLDFLQSSSEAAAEIPSRSDNGSNGE